MRTITFFDAAGNPKELSADDKSLLAQLIVAHQKKQLKKEKEEKGKPIDQVKLKNNTPYQLPNVNKETIQLSDSIILTQDGLYRVVRKGSLLGTGSEATVKEAPLEISLTPDSESVTVKLVDVADKKRSQKQTPLIPPEQRKALRETERTILQAFADQGSTLTIADREGKEYLFEPKIPGKELFALNKEEKPSHIGLEPLEGITVIIKLIDAIQKLHTTGYVHMDLKPENTLVDIKADGTINVTPIDYSCSTQAGRENSCPGTPLYMINRSLVPEKAYIANVNWDIFALGIMCMEILRIGYSTINRASRIAEQIFTEPVNSLNITRAQTLVDSLLECVDYSSGSASEAPGKSVALIKQKIKEMLKTTASTPNVDLEEVKQAFINLQHSLLDKRFKELKKCITKCLDYFPKELVPTENTPLLSSISLLRKAFTDANTALNPSQKQNPSQEDMFSKYNKICRSLLESIQSTPPSLKKLNPIKRLYYAFIKRFGCIGNERKTNLQQLLTEDATARAKTRMEYCMKQQERWNKAANDPVPITTGTPSA